MGSSRDGVSVPYDKHGVRVSGEVRAKARLGLLPSQQEIPRHKPRKSDRKKPFIIRVTTRPFEGLDYGPTSFVHGRYATREQRDEALTVLRRKDSLGWTYEPEDPA